MANQKIDVNLNLVASEDLKKLESLVQQFQVVIDKSLGTGGSGVTGGAGKSRSSSDPQYSEEKEERMNPKYSNRWQFWQHQLLGRLPVRAKYNPTNPSPFGPLRTYGGIAYRAPYMGAHAITGLMNAVALPLLAGQQFANAAIGVPSALQNFMISSGIAGLGVQSGASDTNGWFGSPLFSSAFNQGFANQYINPLSNLFNLNYSAGTARGVNSALINMGYGGTGSSGLGSQGLQMQSVLAGLGTNTINQMGGPSAVAMMLDPQRYGGSSIAGLAGQIRMLSTAAKEANYSLSQTTATFKEVTQAIAQGSGTSAQAAGAQIYGMMGMTGFGPDVASKPLQQPASLSNPLTGMEIMAAHGNVYQAMWGKNRGLYALTAIGRMLGAPFGGGWAGLRASLQNPATRGQTMNRLSMMYLSDPSLFGGYNPEQILTLANEGMGTQQNRARGFLNQALAAAEAHPATANMSSLFNQAQNAGISAQEITRIMNMSGGKGAQLAALQNDLSNRTSAVRNRAAQLTYFDLTDTAKKVLIPLMNQNNNSSSSNTNPAPSPYAMYITSSNVIHGH